MSFLILGWAATAEIPADISKKIQFAFGANADQIESSLKQHQYTEQNPPESQLHPGDIQVFFHSEDFDRMLAKAQVPDFPKAYRNGLLGLRHVAMVAKSGDVTYSIETPWIQASCFEFTGSTPYIVLRPKASAVKNRARFEKAVNELAYSFYMEGFAYNSAFRTSAFHWSPEEKFKLRAQFSASFRNKEFPKPDIPDQYCAEIPVTIHSLLGIDQRQTTTLGEIIDLGTQVEIKNGKSPELIVRETVDGLVGSVTAAAERMIRLVNEAQEKLKNEPNPEAEAYYKKLIGQNEYEIAKVRNLKPDLERALNARLGITNANCETCRKEQIQKLKDQLWAIFARMKSLYIDFKLETRVVRPIDFVLDTLRKDGNYEIVGFYAGDMKAKCEVKK